jgi:hypothetical protein
MKTISIGKDSYITLKDYRRECARLHMQIKTARDILKADGVQFRSFRNGAKHIPASARVHSMAHGVCVLESEALAHIKVLKERARYLRISAGKIKNTKSIPAVTVTKRAPSKVVAFLLECAIPAFFMGFAYAIGVSVVLATIAWLG